MARKKRLNVKFLVILGIPTVLLAVGIVGRFVVPKYFPQVKWFFRGTPTEHAAKAKAFFDAGDYKNAREEYGYAIRLTGAGDAILYTQLADCYSHLILDDTENIQRMLVCWNQALGVDPTYMPALKSLLAHAEAQPDLCPPPQAKQWWDLVQTTAGKILAIDPKNQEAQIAQHRATLERWQLGVDTDPSRVDEAIAALLAIAQQTPFSADAVDVALQAQMYKANERLKASDRSGASVIFADVSKTIDEMLAAHPDDAAIHFHASHILSLLGRLERGAGQPPKYVDRVREESMKAAQLMKPTDRDYVAAKLEWASALESQDDHAGAIALCRDLMKERPTDLSIRLILAALSGRDNASDATAVAVLEQIPPPDPKETYGIAAQKFSWFQILVSLSLIDAKIESLAEQPDPAKRDATIKQVEEVYAKVTANPGWTDHPLALLARGRIELAKGDALHSVQTLERALNMMPTDSSPQRMRVMWSLANANIAMQQSGRAMQLLKEVIDRTGNDRARLIMARLLLSQGNTQDARVHLDVLAKKMPDSVDVMCLQIRALDKDKDADRISALYDKLPEKTVEEMVVKAQMAEFREKLPESIRLLEMVREAKPDDLSVLAVLVRLYAKTGDVAKANLLVDGAIAKHPDRPELKMLQTEIAGGDNLVLRRDMIANIANPLTRELLFYRLEAEQGNAKEAFEHLANAAKIDPNDRRVLDLQFQNALRSRQFDLAAQYADALGKVNGDLAGGLIYRIRLAMARGQINEASGLALQLTKTFPEFAGSWDTLGEIQRAQGKFNEAAQSYELALSKQADDMKALTALIMLNYDMHQPSAARAYIDRGRRLRPDNAQFKEMEVAYELNFGDPEKAIAPRKEMLQQAIDAKSPVEDRAWQAMGETYMAVARSKDNPQAAAPFIQQAADTYKQASAKWPNQIKFVQLYSDVMLTTRNFAEGEKAIRALMASSEWQGKPEPTILLADYFGRAGKPDEQEKVLRDYLAATPTAVAAQVRLSSLLSRQGKYDDAMKLLDANRDDPAIRRQRIELQIANNHLHDAEEEISSVLATTPNPSPMLLNRQAFVYMQSGRATQALQVLDKVLSKDPGNSEALFYRASVYVNNRTKLDQAIQDFQTLRDLPGMELNVRTLLSDAYHYNGDDESAMRELEDALRLFPAEKLIRLKLLDYYCSAKPPRWIQAERALREARALPQLANDVEIIHAEAIMWMLRKDLQKAAELVTTAMKLAPDNVKLIRTWCDIMVQDRQWRQILASTDPMVQQKKAPWWMYEYRGRAKKGIDDRQGALDDFSTGLDLASASQDDAAVTELIDTIVVEFGVGPAKARMMGPADKGDNSAMLLMASLADKENDLDGALQWTEKVMIDPNASPLHLATARRRAAEICLKQNPPDVAKAVKLYKEMLDKDPNDLVALNNVACAMILPKSGFDPKEALRYSQQAFNLVQAKREVNAYIYDTQGYVLVKAGRVQEGIDILRQSIDKEPLPEACYHMGEAYLALPQPLYSDAEENLKQALALLDAMTRDKKPLDVDLKSKIEKALERARPTEAAKPS